LFYYSTKSGAHLRVRLPAVTSSLGLQVELAVLDALDEGVPLAVTERQCGLGGVFGIPNHHLRIGGLYRYAEALCRVVW